MFRILDEQPNAETIVQVQVQVQADRFDVIYNTERPYQALPSWITPQPTWEATLKADPTRPRGATIRPVG